MAARGALHIQTGAVVNVAPVEVQGFQGTFVSGGDLLSLEGGTLATSEISFHDGGSADANFAWTSGTLHVGAFHGNLTNSAGTLAPGTSIGATQIQGDYNQLANATLDIEIGPSGQGAQNDSVSVTGAATIDGLLLTQLSRVNSSRPPGNPSSFSKPPACSAHSTTPPAANA